MSFLDLLEKLNQLDEHASIEAKTARDQAGASILETISAFANEPGLGGGDILLGLKRNDAEEYPLYVITGVSDPDKLQTDIASQCATTFNVPIRPEITVESVEVEHDGRRESKQVITIHINEAQPSEKPVYFRSKGLPKGAFRRIGSSDIKCTDDDLLVLYQGRQNQTYDEILVQDADLSELDPDAIEEYRKVRATVNPDAEELQWSNEELLKALRCVKNINGEARPTVAGLLLFGNSKALRRCFPMMRADYIRVPGKTWVENPDERFQSIDMRGPLIRLIRRVQTTIADDLPSAFSLEANAVQRRDTPLIPLRAIREAVVNALMHRDYRVNSPVQIIRYANRIEIRNPGYSLKSQDRLGEPGSEARNPTIAAVLHETNFAETKGSGIGVMRRQMEDAHLPPPALESDREKNEFAVFFLFHHLLGEDDLQWLARFHKFDLSEDDQRALVMVRELGAIDNLFYRNLNRVDTLTASQRLRHLRDLGLLSKQGKGSATYYVPTAKLIEDVRECVISIQGELPLSERVESLSEGVQPLSEGTTPLSEGVQPLLSDKTPQIPTDIQESLSCVGERSKPEDIRAIILRLCAWRPHKPSELAQLLNRNQNYLVSDYLSKMIKDGLLEYTIPDIPSHANQAYQTTGREAAE